MTNATSASADSLIFVDLASAPNATASMNNAQDLAQLPHDLVTTMISVDALPHIEIPKDITDKELEARSSSENWDNAGQVHLLGVYSGQIQARIERGWRRPRTPVEGASDGSQRRPGGQPFQCAAQILQDETGEVLEVLLPQCNGTPEWQHSLVSAILQASPLPAPPDPTVFRRTITLSFVASSYSSGADENDYPSVVDTASEAAAQ